MSEELEDSKICILKRMQEHVDDCCWQYSIRGNNLERDLLEAGLTLEETNKLKVSDFEFREVESKKGRQELAKFIERHEWLGNISQFTTHWFGAYYKGILAGVILMNMPNAFSKVVGYETKKLERLVSRGACISWSPKNLASNMLMWCIKYMVKNTRYRVFSAYSDPTAKELGTIYQACNWYYIGQASGATKRYINPYTGRLISDRSFRARSFYKLYAKELGIEWQPEWNSDQKMHWELMPPEVESKLREMSKTKQQEAKFHIFPPKHKYVYVLGKDNGETKYLNRLFKKLTKTYPYPKERGK